MDRKRYPYHELALLVVWIFFFSCSNSDKTKDKEIVATPAEMDNHIADNIKTSLNTALEKDGKLDDSTRLSLSNIVQDYYKATDYAPAWSKEEKWQPLGDSLFNFISHAELEGLFPADYHFKDLHSLKTTLDADSLKRMDAALWTRADLLMTDGFMRIVRDLKLGRLRPDSLSSIRDTSLQENFYVDRLKALTEKKTFTTILNELQPKHAGYWELKKGIKPFIDSMDKRVYTYVNFPYKKGDANDSIFFMKMLKKRLAESAVWDASSHLPDSTELKAAISKIQKQKGITVDGKVGPVLIRTLNTSDAERFKRIAITLDRYKQMPEKMPVKYIWVNLPGYYLKVMDHDTLVLQSKIICGKPETRTPLLTSEITDMVTYPTWTVPTSIIAKSYLPRLKKNPNYLARIGLKLMNGKGEAIDPSEVNWSKYSKGIPFKVMQASGDNNALGVMKFNFNNKYDVYLHDTNQRYLFKNSSRALSHGCVRVQEWQQLAFYLARNDSATASKRDTLRYNSDSIRNWVAHKERHRIDVKNQVPLFIRYFSCEGKDGKIIFYEDIYGEDKVLREKYFANKQL